uniref:Uncharacterized protein n=2 Tax=Oryza sativa subsp. japonica TaxID=39947 RepID=Q75LY6_ORYSJ|nr:hypothetical protein [Oryza sativa Japonica Group]ABF98150.1 hypothetical protein LOC_Os03g47110 [Oryza sativa Japonica Group]
MWHQSQTFRVIGVAGLSSMPCRFSLSCISEFVQVDVMEKDCSLDPNFGSKHSLNVKLILSYRQQTQEIEMHTSNDLVEIPTLNPLYSTNHNYL